MIRRPPRSTQSRSSAASDVYKRQPRESVDPIYIEGLVRTCSRPSSTLMSLAVYWESCMRNPPVFRLLHGIMEQRKCNAGTRVRTLSALAYVKYISVRRLLGTKTVGQTPPRQPLRPSATLVRDPLCPRPGPGVLSRQRSR